MAKITKQTLCALLAALMLFGAFGAAAVAVDDLDAELETAEEIEAEVIAEPIADIIAAEIIAQEVTEEVILPPGFEAAEEIGMIIPKLVSPAGNDGLLATGSNVFYFKAPSTTRYRIRSTSLGFYWSWQKIADIFSFDFLFNFTFLPRADLAVTIYNSDFEVIAAADNSGFPFFKNNRYDFRETVPMQKDEIYYFEVETKSTIFDLPYLFSVYPWI